MCTDFSPHSTAHENFSSTLTLIFSSLIRKIEVYFTLIRVLITKDYPLLGFRFVVKGKDGIRDGKCISSLLFESISGHTKQDNFSSRSGVRDTGRRGQVTLRRAPYESRHHPKAFRPPQLVF